MFRVNSSRPSGPTTKLNVDAVVEFGGFGESRCRDWGGGGLS